MKRVSKQYCVTDYQLEPAWALSSLISHGSNHSNSTASFFLVQQSVTVKKESKTDSLARHSFLVGVANFNCLPLIKPGNSRFSWLHHSLRMPYHDTERIPCRPSISCQIRTHDQHLMTNLADLVIMTSCIDKVSCLHCMPMDAGKALITVRQKQEAWNFQWKEEGTGSSMPLSLLCQPGDHDAFSQGLNFTRTAPPLQKTPRDHELHQNSPC